MTDAFVSYADHDWWWVEHFLLAAFEQAGISVQHERAFRRGSIRLREFEKAVRTSDWTVLIVSQAYLADETAEFVSFMAQHFDTAERLTRVIPLVIDEAVDLRRRLGLFALTGVHATTPDEWERGVAQVIETLDREVLPPPPPPPCPYPGMRPFTEDDSEKFFGRATDISDLAAKLELSPLLAVVGPSGSGKSSLVRAGLTKHLRKSRAFGPGGWEFRRLRPGKSPSRALASKVGELGSDPAGTLQELLDDSGAARLLLIVDQFEEVFTQAAYRSDKGEDEEIDSDLAIEGFFADLERVAAVDGCYVILTMRADFYGDLMLKATDLWRRIADTEIKLPPMRRQQLREAIVLPAEFAGVYVQDTLVERLLNDAANEPGMLPLVQATLTRLWDEGLHRKVLPLDSYQTILVLPASSYSEEPPTGLQAALANHANAALGELTEAQKRIAERVFVRLVDFGSNRADIRRQQTEVELRVAGESEKDLATTLDVLIDRRLLTPDAPEHKGGPRRIDLAHEALIGGWPRYQEWLDTRHDAEQTRRRLVGKAKEWARLGKGEAALLDDVELREATTWLAQHGRDLGADEVLEELVARSREKLDELERERERRARRKTQVTIGAVILASVAVAIAVFAVFQLLRANKQERLAVSRQMAAETAAGAGTRPDTELLLSLEAYRVEQTVEARGAVLATLAAHSRLTRFLHGHADRVLNAEFSSDGSFIATSGQDAAVLVFDAASGARVGEPLRGHTRSVYGLAFQPDASSSLLASSDDDGTLRLWDYRSMAPIGEPVQVSASWTRTLAFNPADPNILAAGSRDGVIRIFDVAQRPPRKLNEFLAHGTEQEPEHVTSVAFSPDGRVLASGGDDLMVRLWDAMSGEQIGREGADHNERVRGVAFHPTDPILASVSNDRSLIWWLWDETAGLNRRPGNDNNDLPAFVLHEQRIYDLAFSADGSAVATASADGTVVVWKTSTGRQYRRSDGSVVAPLTAHKGAVRAVGFHPTVDPFGREGNSLVTASNDRTAGIWNFDAAPRPGSALDGQGTVDYEVLARHPGGTRVVVGTDDGTLQQWDAARGERLGAALVHGEEVRAAAYNRDGTLIASGGGDCTIRLWNSADGGTARDPLTGGHNRQVNIVGFAPQGSFLVSGGWDGTVVVWDLANGTSRRLASMLRADESSPGECGDANQVGPVVGRISTFWFTPDGEWLVVYGNDGASRVWPWTAAGPGEEATSGVGEAANRPEPDPTMTYGLSLASDEIFVWELPEGWTPTGSLGEPDLKFFAAEPRVAVFGPGGTLVSGHQDGTIRIWDLESGKPVGGPVPTGAPVRGLVALNEEDSVATAGDSETLVVWSLDIENWLDQVCPIANRNLTPVEWDLLVPGRGYDESCPGLPVPP